MTCVMQTQVLHYGSDDDGLALPTPLPMTVSRDSSQRGSVPRFDSVPHRIPDTLHPDERDRWTQRDTAGHSRRWPAVGNETREEAYGKRRVLSRSRSPGCSSESSSSASSVEDYRVKHRTKKQVQPTVDITVLPKGPRMSADIRQPAYTKEEEEAERSGKKRAAH